MAALRTEQESLVEPTQRTGTGPDELRVWLTVTLNSLSLTTQNLGDKLLFALLEEGAEGHLWLCPRT